jgi:hypothetical protein
MRPATLADMHESAKTAKGVPVGASIDTWLQRFAASDAQEEEVIDQSSAYRALLGEKTPDPEVADKAPQPTQRRLRKPAPSP